MDLSKKRRTFVKWFSVGLVLLVAAISCVPLILARDNRLDIRTVRLLPTRDWRRSYGAPDYYWLETGALLYFRRSDADSVAAVEQRVLPPESQQLPATVRNPITSRSRDVFYDASPDGNWIMTFSQEGNYFVRSIAAGQRRPDIAIGGNYGYWTPDSRAVICFDWFSDPRRGSAMKGVGERIYVDDQKREQFKLPPDLSNHAWSDGVLGVLPDERILLMRDSELGRANQPLWTAYTFAIVNAHADSATEKIWNVPLQQGSIAARAALSSHGDRLIWVVERAYTSPLDRLLQKLRFAARSKPTYRVSWSVSSLDGSGMREVAFYDTTDAGELDRTTLRPILTPDKRYLSFIRDEWLCVVPVE
jgi:hypothetical protein